MESQLIDWNHCIRVTNLYSKFRRNLKLSDCNDCSFIASRQAFNCPIHRIFKVSTMFVIGYGISSSTIQRACKVSKSIPISIISCEINCFTVCIFVMPKVGFCLKLSQQLKNKSNDKRFTLLVQHMNKHTNRLRFRLRFCNKCYDFTIW